MPRRHRRPLAALQLAFTYVPFMETFFDTRPVGLAEGLMILVIGPVLLVVLEAEKRLARRVVKAPSAGRRRTGPRRDATP